MKYTLLDMTQTILSSMDSDEVNSINDTVESQQVAQVIRTAYFDLINRANLPEHWDLIQLDASGDSLKPCIMYLPDQADKVKWLKYDSQTTTDPQVNFQEVCYLPLDTFLSNMDQLRPDADDVGLTVYATDNGSFKLYYKNNGAPTTYSSIDDHTLIFNSYDSALETTLQSSKTRAYARLMIDFDLDDSFTPDLDEPQFALLLAEAKSLAWAELKQSPHQKAEQAARRGWSQLGKTKVRSDDISDFQKLPSFGRKY